MVDRSVDRPRVNGRPGRSVSPVEAMKAIADGSRVFISGGCAVPVAILEVMAKARGRWSSIEIVADYLLEPLPLFAFPGEPFRLTSLQPSRAVSSMADAGALAIVSSSLRHYASLTGPGRPLSLDVAIVNVSPPGPEGRFSLGVSVGTPVEMIANAPLVIAQVNTQMPYTYGAGELDRDEFDLLVEAEHPLVELTSGPMDEVSSIIGGHVASQIADRSVLQFGVGAIPEAVLGHLTERRDLGIHGGMIGDTVVDLHKTGALTGAFKATWPGRMVVGAVLGSSRSFAFADRNPELLMVPSTISHGPGSLGRHDRFVGINSAVEVALDGSINAEAAGSRILSGPGGQPDFFAGAAEASDGKAIIAMPATAGKGSRSRIVATLDPGTPVTVQRSLADLVVTEFGVAELKGRTFAERAEALRAVAHPNFRAELGDR